MLYEVITAQQMLILDEQQRLHHQRWYDTEIGIVITSYSIHYTKLYEVV